LLHTIFVEVLIGTRKARSTKWHLGDTIVLASDSVISRFAPVEVDFLNSKHGSIIGIGIGGRGFAIGPGCGVGFGHDGQLAVGAGIRAGLGVGSAFPVGMVVIVISFWIDKN
jgi:hypothetical protein